MNKRGFPRWLRGEASACNAGDAGSTPGSGRPLEKEMSTPSSIVAWEIPEEPGGQQSMGSPQESPTKLSN